MVYGFHMDTVLPIINLFLGLAAFVWGMLRTTSRWLEYPRELRLTFTAIGLLMIVVLEATLERITDSEPSNFTVVSFTFAWLFMLFVLWRTRDALYRTGTRAPGNGDSISPNRAITASHVPADSEQGPQPVELEGDRP